MRSLGTILTLNVNSDPFKSNEIKGERREEEGRKGTGGWGTGYGKWEVMTPLPLPPFATDRRLFSILPFAPHSDFRDP